MLDLGCRNGRLMAIALEALGSGEHQFSDPIERIALSAAVAEGAVLDPAAYLVEAAVGQAHDVEQG